jgi:uroporphyrinogen-III synthase/uroporphyrinogen III methyltransferase/synthase
VRGRRVLLPRPAEGRLELLEGLAAAGAEVVAVDAYRTRPTPPERLAPIRSWLLAGELDALAFASPSAVRAVVEALGTDARLLDGTLLDAIGPTTADAIRQYGLSPGVIPTRHTARDLADALAERLESD